MLAEKEELDMISLSMDESGGLALVGSGLINRGFNLVRQIDKLYEAKFADAGLEDAIRTALNKPHGDISIYDLNSLQILNASLKNIHSLAGIENLTALEDFQAMGNHLQSFSELEKLQKLQKLNLSHNEIEDLRNLSKLKNLSKIHLGRNRIHDISVLTNLRQVKDLVLSYNRIQDISPLAELTDLEELHFKFLDLELLFSQEIHSSIPIFFNLSHFFIRGIQQLLEIRYFSILLLQLLVIFLFSLLLDIHHLIQPLFKTSLRQINIMQRIINCGL